MDGVKRKYVKWISGLDKVTPNYILIKKTKMKELRLEAIKKAIKKPEKITRKSKKKLVIEYLNELEKEELSRGESKWKKKKREIMERAGISKDQLNRKREIKETKEIVGFCGEIEEGRKKG